MGQLERFFQQGIVVEINLPHRQIIRGTPICVDRLQLFRGESFGFSFGLHIYSDVRARGLSKSWIDREIINSSFVRMTRTLTRLSSAEMIAACSAFWDASNSRPRKSRPSQMRARMEAWFSPMPPEKTSVSSPPSTAV